MHEESCTPNADGADRARGTDYGRVRPLTTDIPRRIILSSLTLSDRGVSFIHKRLIVLAIACMAMLQHTCVRRARSRMHNTGLVPAGHHLDADTHALSCGTGLPQTVSTQESESSTR